MKTTATVAVEIDWHQTLNALRELAETREVERLTLHDVQKIERAATRVRERVMRHFLEQSSAAPKP